MKDKKDTNQEVKEEVKVDKKRNGLLSSDSKSTPFNHIPVLIITFILLGPLLLSLLDSATSALKKDEVEEVDYSKDNIEKFDDMFAYIADNEDIIKSEIDTHGEFYYPINIEADNSGEILRSDTPIKLVASEDTADKFTELADSMGDKVYTHFLYREKKPSTTNLERKLVIENFGREQNQYKSYVVLLQLP